jgi:hypothetical protein
MRHDLFGERFHVSLARGEYGRWWIWRARPPLSALDRSREAPNSASSPMRSIQLLAFNAVPHGVEALRMFLKVQRRP